MSIPFSDITKLTAVIRAILSTNKMRMHFSRTRKGGWAIAQSPIKTTTITLERLAKRGYESLLD